MNAREAAFGVLLKTEKDGAFLNLIEKEYFEKLEGRERSFANALVLSVLENKIKIDYVISVFVNRPVKDIEVLTALRMGTAQLLFMTVPESAAVNESVKLLNSTKKKALSGFVNAVLRNIAKGRGEIVFPKKEDDFIKYLSCEYSYPEWLVQLLRKQYGDETEALLSYRRQYSGINLRIIKGKTVSEELKNSSSPSKYHENAVISEISAIESMKNYKNGSVTPQSESSMFCVEAAGIKKGMTVLDLCAAPGGKSAYASEFEPSRIVSCDIYPNRVELIRKNFERLSVKAETYVNDASVYKEDFSDSFDRVLVDAPCSSMGLMYRKPDIKYSKSNGALRDIIHMQRKILETASKYVKKGGILVYSTCSVNKKENASNVERFLKAHQEFELSTFEDETLARLSQDNTGEIQLLPHKHGTDGFYIARLLRKY